MQVQALIVRCKTYNFEDEKTGRHIEGANLTVLVSADKTAERVGYEVLTMSVKPDQIEHVFAQASEFVGKPATIEADFKVAPDGKGTKWTASRILPPAARSQSVAA